MYSGVSSKVYVNIVSYNNGRKTILQSWPIQPDTSNVENTLIFKITSLSLWVFTNHQEIQYYKGMGVRKILSDFNFLVQKLIK